MIHNKSTYTLHFWPNHNVSMFLSTFEVITQYINEQFVITFSSTMSVLTSPTTTFYLTMHNIKASQLNCEKKSIVIPCKILGFFFQSHSFIEDKFFSHALLIVTYIRLLINTHICWVYAKKRENKFLKNILFLFFIWS